MEEIVIKQTKRPVGFWKPVDETPLQDVVFDNGKIAYLNSDDEICAAPDENALVKNLKQGSCYNVEILRAERECAKSGSDKKYRRKGKQSDGGGD